MKAKPNENLRRHVRALREMREGGWDVDLLLEVAFGEGGYVNREFLEKPQPQPDASVPGPRTRSPRDKSRQKSCRNASV